MKSPETKTVDDDKQKGEMLLILGAAVSARMQRELDHTEMRSLGYLIERLSPKGNPFGAESFLFEALGVLPEDDARIVARKVQTKLYECKLEDSEDRRTRAKTQEDAKREATIQAFMTAYHQMAGSQLYLNARPYLGAVPEYLLPEWVKSTF